VPTTRSRPKNRPQVGFHHIAIRVRDFDRSVGFYTGVLGFPAKVAWGQQPGRAVMLDTGNGNYLEVFERPGQAPATQEGQILHLALRTDHCDTLLERVRAAGCTVTMEPKSVEIPSTPSPTPVHIAFFTGPDGELVELFQNELT
jgi:glyoxylase I family protein